jgi:hypothetical protein
VNHPFRAAENCGIHAIASTASTVPDERKT